jgi:hypothetical protein
VLPETARNELPGSLTLHVYSSETLFPGLDRRFSFDDCGRQGTWTGSLFMSKKKERSRQDLNAQQYDLDGERDEMERSANIESFDYGDNDEMDEDVHNPNVDKQKSMKRKERDNIE